MIWFVWFVSNVRHVCDGGADAVAGTSRRSTGSRPGPTSAARRGSVGHPKGVRRSSLDHARSCTSITWRSAIKACTAFLVGTAVLLGMSRRDPLEADPEAQPPDREFAEPIEGVCRRGAPRSGFAVDSSRINAPTS